MSAIPYAERKRTSYESFVAKCPWCGQEIIFNRATDLKNLRPISFLAVSCLNRECGKPFNINGDAANSAHEMLVFDCYELLQLKHYRNCIVTLAQAYEVFFALFLRVELLYKPFAHDIGKDTGHLNRLAGQLNDKVKEHTFARMRALFLQQLLSGRRPVNLAEAEAEIAGLDDRPTDPKDTELTAPNDRRLVDLLKALKSVTINTLRNRVVHKQAYRPTREQAEAALEEARSLLFPLTSRLDLHHDINWYMKRS